MIHQQYNLIFRTRVSPILGKRPICELANQGNQLQAELRAFIDRSSNKGEGLVDSVLVQINNILNGTWTGSEQEGDNFFITETEEAIRLDLHDGYAYLGQQNYGWLQLPRMPLQDLKNVFQEWIAFRNSVYS